jgi:hypothetical protein
MSRVRLAIVLPAAQFVAAVIMLYIGGCVEAVKDRLFDSLYFPTISSICRGINAPAALFKPVLLLFVFVPENWDRAFTRIFGYSVNPSFFIGVVVVWYLVGRQVDRRRLPRDLLAPQKLTSTILKRIFLVLAGVVILLLGLRELANPGMFNNFLGTKVEGTLFIVWSAALVILPVAATVNQVRGRTVLRRAERSIRALINHRLS